MSLFVYWTLRVLVNNVNLGSKRRSWRELLMMRGERVQVATRLAKYWFGFQAIKRDDPWCGRATSAAWVPSSLRIVGGPGCVSSWAG